TVALESFAESGLQARTDIKLNPKAFAPEIRKLTSSLFAAAKSGQWEETADGIRFPSVECDGAPVTVSGDAYALVTSVSAASDEAASVLESGAFVVLATAVDAELEAEGYARDLVRLIQDERKKAGLHVADRISLSLTVPAERREAV